MSTLKDIALSPVGVAILTLLGVWWQFRQHSDREKTARKMAIRREIFLAFSKALSDAFTYLNTIGSFSTPEEDHQALLKNYASNTCSVSLVGDRDVILCLDKFDHKFKAIRMAFVAERYELMNLKRRCDLLVKDREQMDQFTDFFNKHLLSQKDHDLKIFAAVTDSLNTQFEEQAQALNKIHLELRQKALTMTQKMLPFIGELSEIYYELIFLTRRQMEFESDMPEFVNVMVASEKLLIKKGHEHTCEGLGYFHREAAKIQAEEQSRKASLESDR